MSLTRPRLRPRMTTMQQYHSLSFIASRSAALLGLACTLGLVSCEDKAQTEQPSAPAATTPTATETTAVADKTSEKEILDYMIFSVGDMVRKQAANPTWRNEVRDMRNQLDAYYQTLNDKEDLPTRVRLGLLLADTTRDMSAYGKAMDLYNAVKSDWERQDEAARKTPLGRRIRSAVANGLGSCYLAQNKYNEALTYYEEALEMDKALYRDLAPEGDAPLPAGDNISPDLLRAAEDVISSYRCLGECQFKAEDPEEARDTYKKCQELVMRMKNLKPGMSLQYIRLLSALGNLESSCNQPKRAYAAWLNALDVAQKLRQVAPTAAVQAQTIQFIRQLENSLKSVSHVLKEEQAGAAGQQ